MAAQTKEAKDELVSVSLGNVFRTFRFWPRIFRLLWEAHPGYLAGILAANLLKGVIPAVVLFATKTLINSIVSGVSGESFQPVLNAFMALIAVNVLHDLCSIADSYLRKLFHTLLANHINLRIMAKSQRMSLQSFENADVQDKLQRAQGEADFRPFEIFTQILAILGSIVTLVSSSAILVAWKWWVFFLVMLIPFVSFVSFLRLGQREFAVYFRRAPKQRESWYLSFLVTRDNSFKEVKLYRLGAHLVERYRDILQTFYKEDKVLAMRRSFVSLFFQLINHGATGLVIFLAAQAAYFGQIMLGNLVSMIQAIVLTQTTSQSIVQGILNLCQNNLYIKQLLDFLDMPEEGEKGALPSADRAACIRRQIAHIEKIEMRNVSFRYPGAQSNALSGINLTLEAGQSLAIVGRNGTGKSTVVKLLTQLYEEFDGDIIINGISVRHLDKASIQRRIGVVFQDFVHYEMPVRDNIGFGNVSKRDCDESIWEASDRSGIRSLIESFPEKLDTLLGKWFEEGQQLSGGQWQRVAIARAFMRNADLYILDEPSSFLDPQAENEVFQKFRTLIKEKIGIFISHRFSAARMADIIILMDNGRVAEMGNHEELMAQNGLYAKLFRLQAVSYLQPKEDDGWEGMAQAAGEA